MLFDTLTIVPESSYESYPDGEIVLVSDPLVIDTTWIGNRTILVYHYIDES